MKSLDERLKSGEYSNINEGEDKFIWDVDHEKMQLKTTTALFANAKDYFVELFSIVHNTKPTAVKIKARNGRIDIQGDGAGFNIENINELMSIFFVDPDEGSDNMQRYGNLAIAIYSALQRDVNKVMIETVKNNKPLRYWVEKVKSDKTSKKDVTLSLRFGDNAFKFGNDTKTNIEKGINISIYKNEAKRGFFGFLKKKDYFEQEILQTLGSKGLKPVYFNNKKINTYWQEYEDDKQSDYKDNILKRYKIDFEDEKLSGSIWLDSRDEGKHVILRSGLVADQDLLSKSIDVEDMIKGMNILIDSPYFTLTMGNKRQLKAENSPMIWKATTQYKNQLIAKMADDMHEHFFGSGVSPIKQAASDLYTQEKILEKLRHFLLKYASKREDLPDLLFERKTPTDMMKKIINLPLILDVRDTYHSLSKIINQQTKYDTIITSKYKYMTPELGIKENIYYLDNRLNNILRRCNIVSNDYDDVISEQDRRKRTQERQLKKQQEDVKKEERRQHRSKLEIFVKKLFGRPVGEDISIGEVFKDVGSKGAGYTALVVGGIIVSPVILGAAGVYYVAKGGVYAAKKAGSATVWVAKKGTEEIAGAYNSYVNPVIHSVYDPTASFIGRQSRKVGNGVALVFSTTGNAIADSAYWTKDKIKKGGSFVGRKVYGVYDGTTHLIAKGFGKIGAGYLASKEFFKGVFTKSEEEKLKEQKLKEDKEAKNSSDESEKTGVFKYIKEKILGIKEKSSSQTEAKTDVINTEKKESRLEQWIKRQSLNKQERKALKIKENIEEKTKYVAIADAERKKTISDGELIVQGYQSLPQRMPNMAAYMNSIHSAVIITDLLDGDFYDTHRQEQYSQLRKKFRRIMGKYHDRVKPISLIFNPSQTYSAQYRNLFCVSAKSFRNPNNFNVFSTDSNYGMEVDMRNPELKNLAVHMQTKKGQYALSPFIIEYLGHRGEHIWDENPWDTTKKIVKYSSRQEESYSDVDGYKKSGIMRQVKIDYENKVPYSHEILEYYSNIMKNLKNERVNATMEFYNAKNEERFKSSFETLDKNEVKKVIDNIFALKNSNPQIDAYIESKYPELVGEVGRKNIL